MSNYRPGRQLSNPKVQGMEPGHRLEEVIRGVV
jgi:hypothetical protein